MSRETYAADAQLSTSREGCSLAYLAIPSTGTNNADPSPRVNGITPWPCPHQLT